MESFKFLYETIVDISWQQLVMWVIGGILIFLAIKKEMEPTLLLPMGFGAILMNFPGAGIAEPLETLYSAGIANELFPLILFIGIGATMLCNYGFNKLSEKLEAKKNSTKDAQ